MKPNAQLLITNRWDVGAGEVGALINFSYTRLQYQDSVRRHGFFIANLAGGRSPDWPEIRYFEADRWRPSINGELYGLVTTLRVAGSQMFPVAAPIAYVPARELEGEPALGLVGPQDPWHRAYAERLQRTLAESYAAFFDQLG